MTALVGGLPTTCGNEWISQERSSRPQSPCWLVEILGQTPDKKQPAPHISTGTPVSGGVTASLLRWGPHQTLSSTSQHSVKKLKTQQTLDSEHVSDTFPSFSFMAKLTHRGTKRRHPGTDTQCMCGRLAVNTASPHRKMRHQSRQFVSEKLQPWKAKYCFSGCESLWG